MHVTATFCTKKWIHYNLNVVEKQKQEGGDDTCPFTYIFAYFISAQVGEARNREKECQTVVLGISSEIFQKKHWIKSTSTSFIHFLFQSSKPFSSVCPCLYWLLTNTNITSKHAGVPSLCLTCTQQYIWQHLNSFQCPYDTVHCSL